MQKNKLFNLINIAEFAKSIGKKRSWFSQRLNGSIVNGQPAKFSESEKGEIVKGLKAMKEKIDELITFFENN